MQYYQNGKQPQVSSASVNLTTETAIVWPVSEAKVASNWQKEVGEALAKHLTSCGFTSNLRGLHLVSMIWMFHLIATFYAACDPAIFTIY